MSAKSVTSKKSSGSDKVVVSSVQLHDFFRFTFVLSKLRELDPFSSYFIKVEEGESSYVAKFSKVNWIGALFDSDKREHATGINVPGEVWGLYSREDKRREVATDSILGFKDKGKLATVYECRNFYGTDSPNNLQQRLEKLFKPSKFSSQNGKGRPSKSRHDEYIKVWGEFAFRLVERNGGWKHFSNKESLAEIDNVWVTDFINGERKWTGEADEKIKADQQDTLIQRILFLARDRYVQILTSTAAPLWSLWFLNSEDRRQRLERISEVQSKDFYIGRKLPEQKLYIDCNTNIRAMRGMPFPFGYAADVLDKHSEVEDESWTSSAINTVADTLRDDSKPDYKGSPPSLTWCPPILFGGRGDQWEQPTNEKVNVTVPYIAVGSHVKFGSIYVHTERLKNAKKDGKQLPLENMRIAYEPGSWGEIAVGELRKKFESIDCTGIPRAEMLSTFEDSNFDLVLSYFPTNILIEKYEKYEHLEPKDIYQLFGEDGESLIYDLPSTVLASGLFLSRQPKMTSLIEDLALYLHKVEATLRHLSPNWERTENVKKSLQLLRKNSEADKKKAASDLSNSFNSSLTKSMMFEVAEIRNHIPINEKLVEDWAKEIGKDMAGSILHEKSTKLDDVKSIFNEWGWALLLPFIRDMQVYVSCDLFSSTEG